MCQYAEPRYLYSLLSIQTANLLVDKINVRSMLFCPSEISLAPISFGCVPLIKIDSLKDYFFKNCF